MRLISAAATAFLSIAASGCASWCPEPEPLERVHLPPTAPRNGSIVYARENLIPVTVTNLYMPHRPAGAVVEVGAHRHVLSRGYNNAQTQPVDPRAQGFVPSARPPAADSASQATAGSQAGAADAPPETAQQAPAPQPIQQAQAPRQEHTPPAHAHTAPAIPTRERPQTVYCLDDMTPEQDNCIYPK